MKVPITDKFLWDVYDIISKTGYVLGSTNRVPNLINCFTGMENPIFKKYRDDRNKERFRKLIYYLKKKNYIKIKNLEGKSGIMLTKEGFDKALKQVLLLKRKRKERTASGQC